MHDTGTSCIALNNFRKQDTYITAYSFSLSFFLTINGEKEENQNSNRGIIIVNMINRIWSEKKIKNRNRVGLAGEENGTGHLFLEPCVRLIGSFNLQLPLGLGRHSVIKETETLSKMSL